MKLLTNKQFQGVIDEVEEPLKKEIEVLKDKIFNEEYFYLKKANKLEKQVKEYQSIILTEERFIVELNKKINKLKEEKKLLYGAKGGLTKYIHRLEKELAEANEKLSQRYILKELAPQKAKNMQVMKTKNCSKTSNIIKKVADNNE